MEINATTVSEWLDKMNANVCKRLNSNSVARSSTWIGFASTYDAVNNQIEATYDNGKGSLIRVCYFDFRDTDCLVARAAVEDIVHKSARMNITNMRRHHFIDCQELATRDHVEEKKLYWYFREHAKEHAYDCGNPYYFSASKETWGNFLSHGLDRAFDVGEKRQNKVGISDSETVAQAALNKRLDTARNTIELLDSTQSELIAAGNACDGVFKTVKVEYDNSRARCYMNPYSKCMFAKIPCSAEFKLSKEKCAYANASDVCEGTGVSVSYNLVYDEQFDTVTVSDFGYCFGYYMSRIRLKLDNTMQIVLDITQGLEENDVFDEAKITVPDFKTKVLDAVVNRINKMIAAKAAIA